MVPEWTWSKDNKPLFYLNYGLCGNRNSAGLWYCPSKCSVYESCKQLLHQNINSHVWLTLWISQSLINDSYMTPQTVYLTICFVFSRCNVCVSVDATASLITVSWFMLHCIVSLPYYSKWICCKGFKIWAFYACFFHLESHFRLVTTQTRCSGSAILGLFFQPAALPVLEKCTLT